MHWFLIALIGPILYAISNHIDKYLMDKHCGNTKAGALVIFSALFSVVVLPIVYLIEPTVFSLGFKTSLILLLNGTINIICLSLYFEAIREEESSNVIPFYQTIPVITYILGYFFLNEALNINQVFGGSLIFIGTVIISLNFSGGKIRLKKRVAALMLGASLLYSIGVIIFKWIALDAGFWNSVFWEFAGNVFAGAIIFMFVSSYRKQFLDVFGIRKAKLISLNSINESITLLAEGVSAYAVLLAPVSLVTAVNGFQPLFVLAFGIVIALFFPHASKESLEKNDIAQKILAIGLITIGVYALGVSGNL